VHEIVTLDPDNTGGGSPIALTHDAKGNLTQDATSGGGVALSYDFANQLRQAVVPSGASRGLVGTHTYRYDALGRRVAKVVDTNGDNTPDTTTVFIHNARWQFIAEYSGGAAPASPTRSRVYSAGYIDEPVAQIEHTGTNAGTYYLHRDRQYCLIGLTNASGTIVETYTYTPYGQRIVRDASFANPTTTSSYAQQLGHQGLLHDAETGLIYNRHRILDAALGRFAQRDPLRYIDGVSVYAYVRSEPTSYLDPGGLARAPGNGRPPGFGRGGRWKTIKINGKPVYVDPQGRKWRWHDGDRDPRGHRHNDHWDVTDKHGKKRRLSPDGTKELTDEEAVDNERNKEENRALSERPCPTVEGAVVGVVVIAIVSIVEDILTDGIGIANDPQTVVPAVVLVGTAIGMGPVEEPATLPWDLPAGIEGRDPEGGGSQYDDGRWWDFSDPNHPGGVPYTPQPGDSIFDPPYKQ
jgi:RHS repeat-associated protein